MKNILLLLSLTVFCFNASADEEFRHFELTEQFKEKRMLQKSTEIPMLDKMWAKIKKDGYVYVNKAIEKILKFNHEFELGNHNAPDVGWRSGPGGDLSVAVFRKVKPIDGSTKWRVIDQIEVGIEAGLFLRHLRDNGDIKIDDESLKLFAGVEYRRKYTYYHEAASYKLGLKKQFDKLFMSFKLFRGTNFLNLEKGEFVIKDEYMSSKVALTLETPTVYLMSGFGKGSILFSKLNSLSYRRLYRDQRDGKDFIATNHISKRKGRGLQVGAQADFYKILKITLLSSEYSVNYEKSLRVNIGIDSKTIASIKNFDTAINMLNKGKRPGEIAVLKPLIMSTENGERVEEEKAFSALIWGRYTGNSTEKIIFNSDAGEQKLWRHTSERTRLNKSWWNAVFSSRNINSFETREIENMTFEYEDIGQENFTKVDLPKTAVMSLTVSKEYRVNKAKKIYRDKVVKLIESFESVDQDIVAGVEDEVLNGPFELNLHAQIEQDGVFYFLNQELASLDKIFSEICSGRYLKSCKKSLNGKYKQLLKKYDSKGVVDLSILKSLIKTVSHYSDNYKPYKDLFSRDYVFLYGDIRSVTRDDNVFQTYLTDGKFNTGIINKLLKKSLN